MLKLPSIWSQWLASVWSRLLAGEHISVPSYLPHPGRSGFSKTSLAEDYGQLENWVSRFNKSRLHIHEFSDEMKVHLDKTAPEGGPVAAITHWFTESPRGRVVGAVAIGLTVGAGAAFIARRLR